MVPIKVPRWDRNINSLSVSKPLTDQGKCWNSCLFFLSLANSSYDYSQVTPHRILQEPLNTQRCRCFGLDVRLLNPRLTWTPSFGNAGATARERSEGHVSNRYACETGELPSSSVILKLFERSAALGVLSFIHLRAKCCRWEWTRAEIECVAEEKRSSMSSSFPLIDHWLVFTET